ncbi:hypothetical protein Ancab_037051 [Ancistrocladus abbreviatus]
MQGCCMNKMMMIGKKKSFGRRWQPFQKDGATNIPTLPFICLFILCAFLLSGWLVTSIFSNVALKNPFPPATLNITETITLNRTEVKPKPKPKPKPKVKKYLLNCFPEYMNQTCPRNSYPTKHNMMNAEPPSSSETCPAYFRWIHEDLRPWKERGVTRKMVEKAQKTAHMRVVIVDGRVFVKKYRRAIQTRDVFTLWGILQLLRSYPGRLPDLELMFDCDDRPVVLSKDYKRKGRGSDDGPPPLFRYCSNQKSLDIVFPDWSFWGWAETNIKPWQNASRSIQEGNKRTEWKDRVPYAYWKGNPYVCPNRKDLLKCNVSHIFDWNARLYIQDWIRESKEGYGQSNLEDQCTHRYKIYIEGWAWSVSEKYILACDSMTLLVRPRFHDFFIRGLEPLKHYWPIRNYDKCKSLKFAVEWGNRHHHQAQAIGKAGSNFIHKELKMEFVYDYMFHLLKEYAKLLRFKPIIPRGGVELCPETLACRAEGIWKRLMVESLVKSPRDATPCTLPRPYDPPALEALRNRNANMTRQVEMWEDQYWAKFNKRGGS